MIDAHKEREGYENVAKRFHVVVSPVFIVIKKWQIYQPRVWWWFTELLCWTNQKEKDFVEDWSDDSYSRGLVSKYSVRNESFLNKPDAVLEQR